MRLFGVPSRAVSPAYGPPPAAAAPEACGKILHAEPAAEAEPVRPNLAAELPHLAVADPSAPVWDERGYRISRKLPSAFPRQRYEPRHAGTHWSR